VTTAAAARTAAEAWTAVDPAALPPVELADRVIELRRLIDGLEGMWSQLVAALDSSGAIDGGTAAWLRSACRLSPSAARSRVVLARRLTARPAAAAALSSGEISVDHARLVTTALTELDAAAGPELATATEAPLVAAARRCDPTRLRREIAHARHALVPDAAADAGERAHERRRLDVATTFDGAVVVNGVLDPEGGEALLTALAPLTVPAGRTDTRSPGQRRADGLVELCHRTLDAGTLPALGGERPHVTVVVPLAALTPAARTRLQLPAVPGPSPAATDAHRLNPATTDAHRLNPATTDAHTLNPATTDAHTLNPATTDAHTLNPAMSGRAAETAWRAVLGSVAVRRLACDASVTRVVLDPDGQPLDVGRRTRVIPAAIRTALAVRDHGCVFPGCDRPPPHTDAHHVIHWADGGSTSLDNLALLCRTHHRTVHEGQWRLTRDPDRRWNARPPDGAAPARAAPPRAA
jgi:hypothetical protein